MRLHLALITLIAFAVPSLRCCAQQRSETQQRSEKLQRTEKLGGICFSSFRDNENPSQQIQPLPSGVEADVAAAARVAGAVRTYTVQGSNYLIPEFCRDHEIDCIIGAWIGAARWQNDAQMELVTRLANSGNPRIKSVIIGNEVLHRGDCTEAQLIDYIRTAKEKIELPIATADTWKAWVEHPAVAAEVDICGVQIYPFWEGLPIDGAAEYTVQRVLDVQKQYPDKRIVLTEFGWPTDGETLGQAVPGRENAARYLREILPLLEQHQVEYYYFAVWDENWKLGPEGGVGAHWGLYQSDGTIKPEFKQSLPAEAHVGTERQARNITFQLAVDEPRNARLTEIASGTPPAASNDPDQSASQRGAALNVSSGPGLRNPIGGSRPLRLPSASESDAKTQQTDQGESSADTAEADNEADKPNQTPSNRESENGVSENGNAEDRNSEDGDSEDVNSACGPPTSTPESTNSSEAAPAPEVDLKRHKDQLTGVCLSLFRDNESPHFGVTPLPSEIRADVAFGAKLARAVRTYSVTDAFAFVPDFCDQIKVECYPGAALGKYPWLNDLELEMLIRVGKSRHPSVKALIVGNEVMHRGDFSVEQYINYIRRVKRKVSVPVATAELLHSWMEHPELAEEVDILGVQIYPYWGGLTIDKAAEDTLRSVQSLQQRFPDKPVILTEFGWPTDGGSLGDAEASPENAARYLREVIPLLNENGIDYLYFAMTDEKWKQQDEGGPGAHWGLLDSGGQVKACFEPLVPTQAATGFPRPPRKLTFED